MNISPEVSTTNRNIICPILTDLFTLVNLFLYTHIYEITSTVEIRNFIGLLILSSESISVPLKRSLLTSSHFWYHMETHTKELGPPSLTLSNTDTFVTTSPSSELDP